MGNTETNRVTGDNPNTVAVVEDLLSQLESMGARISQSFQAVVEGSEVSVRYTKEREGVRFVIDVPALCCPILNDFHYTVDKDFKISATLVEEPDNPAALPVMEKLIAFFNETNKLHDWHKNYPVFQLLRFPHILNNLFSITSESELSYLSNLCNSYMNGTEEEASFALLLTFFGSRVMTFDQSSYGDLDIKLKQPKTKCFIPGLDLINHQINGPAFRFYGPGVSVQAGANPGPADEEIYVSYSNICDPLRIFSKYGFVDRSATWVYSVPLTVKLNNGKDLTITSQYLNVNEDELPEDCRKLVDYFPGSISVNDDGISTSLLKIPKSENADTFRGILRHIVSQVMDSEDPDYTASVSQEVEELEQEIITLTFEYWQNIRTDVQTALNEASESEKNALGQVMDLCDLYLYHIQEYTQGTKASKAA